MRGAFIRRRWLLALAFAPLACGPAGRDAQVSLKVVRGDFDPMRDPGSAERDSSPVGSLEVAWLGATQVKEVVVLGPERKLSVRLEAPPGTDARVALRGLRARDGAVYSGGRTPTFRAGAGEELEVPLFMGPLEAFTPVGSAMPGPRLQPSVAPLGARGALIVGGVERRAGGDVPAEPYLVLYRLAEAAWCTFPEEGCLAGENPPGRLGGIAVPLKDGGVLHGLGQLLDGSPDASLYVTDAEGRTQALALSGEPLPPLVGAGALLLPDGAVLIAGGQLGPSGSHSVFRLDSATGWVTVQPQLLEARVAPGLAALENGPVLVAGGAPQLGAPAVDSAELFTPGKGSQALDGGTFARARKRMRGPRRSPAMVRLADNSVLVLGGGTAGVDVFQLTLGGNVGGFVDLSVPPALELWSPSAVRLRKNEVLLAGGEAAGAAQPFAALFTPDPDQEPGPDAPSYSGRYRPVGASATLRGWPALAELPDGSALLVGGGVNGEVGSADAANPGSPRVEVFVPDPLD